MCNRNKTLFSLVKIPFVSILFLLSCSSTHTGIKETARPTTPKSQSQAREGKWNIRDTKLLVRDIGPTDSPILLVVHGGPGGNHLSQRPLEALTPQYRVVLYDQRGTGESDRFNISLSEPASMGKLTLEQNVEDIEALRKKLGQDKISLLGHSWGAALAVFYAAAYPQHVEKLIVYSGGPETLELAERKKQAHNAKLNDEEKALMKERMIALKTAVDNNSPQHELDELFGRLASVLFPTLYCKRPGASGYDEMGRGGFWANQVAGQYVESFKYESIIEKLKLVQAPTLLTWGRCEPSPQERLTNLLDYLPNAQFVIFENSGHNAMEEEEKLFFDTIRAFLDGEQLPTKFYSSRAELQSTQGPP